MPEKNTTGASASLSALPAPWTDGIAIIGMSARFAGARNVRQFWEKIVTGEILFSDLSEEDLRAAGVDEAQFSRPEYVRRGSILEDAESFDAPFFGFTRREAEITDPQQRVFLETAWEALEDAGYTGDGARVGVFGGVSINAYFFQLNTHPDLVDSVGGYQMMLASDKDFLSSRVAYKLNLRGPAVVIQTACSTSLTAVHVACQSLHANECDMALAGGVSIPPQGIGYPYIPGMILSPDGYCRPFDKDAKGTVPGRGAAIVVLKRLSLALRDGDSIYAVIRGSACNNDGAAKIGYTAPGIEGQASVIREAQRAAGVSAHRIGYVEAHGTATELGDPIEVAALNDVFAGCPPGSCVLGALKANLGHADVAAGVAGLVKAALAVQAGIIPPTPNFVEPAPSLALNKGPFAVSASAISWAAGEERWAGVSSFGIGGTNVHVVLSSAPLRDVPPAQSRTRIFPVSARTSSALAQSRERLARHLENHPSTDLSAVASTLQVGRRPMEHRFAAVAVNAPELVTQLRRSASPTQQSVQSARDVVFLFPGQGQQFLGMAAGLYREDPSFRQIIDSGAQLLRDEFRLDVLGMLTGTEPVGKDKDSLTETSFAQPLLFLLEYALAARWRALGVEPRALLGHSLGELTAAAVAGVFTFEDGLRLAAERGRMMSETPAGLMLAVGLPSEALTRYFGADLWLAAENGPKLSVASGLPAAIENLEKQLAKDRIATVRLASRNAFHSPLMSDAAKTFRNRVAVVARREPSIPWLSNVSGTWIEAAEAQNPQYWGNQILSRVRFAKCVAALAEHPRILLEVGPGEALARMASQQLPGSIAIPSLGAENRRSPDDLVFLDSCARLWQAGIDLVWRELQGNEKVRRISLPTYPFERERYWIEPANKAAAQKPVAGNSSSQAAATATDEKRQDISSWFYMPGWQSAPPVKANLGSENSFYGTEWLVLSDASSFADQLVAGLETAGASAARVATAPGLNMLGRYYPNLICLDTMAGSRDSGESFNNLLTLFQSALAAGHRFTQMVLITDRLEQVLEEPIRHVGSSEVQSLFRVMPLEFPGARCRVIDVDTSSGNPVDKILAELRSPVGEPAIVLRGTSRWQKRWIPVSLDKPSTTAFRKGGAYLITGGIGGMGLAIASHLLQRYEARVVLTSRSALPPRQDWGAILESGSVDDEIARRIRRMQEMERYGGRIEFIAADAADREAMSAVIAQMRESYGRIDGVIHAAGVSGGRMIAALDPAEAAEVRRPKVLASRILAELLRGSDLDFLLFCSSISAITPAPGQAAYAAANAFQSYFARYCRQEYGLPAVAIDFDAWQDVGMMAALVLPDGFEDLKAARMRTAMTADEGIEVIERVLGGWPGAEILTSTTALKFVPDQAAPRHSNEQPQRSSTAETTPEVEMILKIWSDLLADHDIGPQDNFFELGGHSLLGTMVLSRIRERTGVQLTLRTLFEAPTPEALAAQIRQSRDSETVPASDAEEREEFEI